MKGIETSHKNTNFCENSQIWKKFSQMFTFYRYIETLKSGYFQCVSIPFTGWYSPLNEWDKTDYNRVILRFQRSQSHNKISAALSIKSLLNDLFQFFYFMSYDDFPVSKLWLKWDKWANVLPKIAITFSRITVFRFKSSSEITISIVAIQIPRSKKK